MFELISSVNDVDLITAGGRIKVVGVVGDNTITVTTREKSSRR
jgi:hypothetical protein